MKVFSVKWGASSPTNFFFRDDVPGSDVCILCVHRFLAQFLSTVCFVQSMLFLFNKYLSQI